MFEVADLDVMKKRLWVSFTKSIIMFQLGDTERVISPS
jgi:hypothetical protein